MSNYMPDLLSYPNVHRDHSPSQAYTATYMYVVTSSMLDVVHISLPSFVRSH
jgi:hypothetical protein